MKVVSLSCLVLFVGALSVGCVAQAGTEDDTSQADEGLTYAAETTQPTKEVSAKDRLQHAPELNKRIHSPSVTTNQLELKELAGTDPGGNVQDDGDGKEPDPHPWHASSAALVSH